MSGTVPTLVGFYAYLGPNPVRAAEFRWTEDDGVTLTVIDEEHGGDVARRVLDQGFEDVGEGRMVYASDGEDFMRTLVEAPSTNTLFGYVDES